MYPAQDVLALSAAGAKCRGDKYPRSTEFDKAPAEKNDVTQEKARFTGLFLCLCVKTRDPFKSFVRQHVPKGVFYGRGRWACRYRPPLADAELMRVFADLAV